MKTLQFSDAVYLGDPLNTLRILNTKQVDELIILDITATADGRAVDTEAVSALASECFMPVCYGGGIRSVGDAESMIRAGCEKVSVNTELLDRPEFADELARALGRQSVVAAIDVKRDRRGRDRVARTSGRVSLTRRDPVQWAAELVDRGAGEILLTSVDRDGTASGYELDLIGRVAGTVDVPVLACGGAGSLGDLRMALKSGAAGAAAGRMFVTHGRFRAALVSYPSSDEIDALER